MKITYLINSIHSQMTKTIDTAKMLKEIKAYKKYVYEIRVDKTLVIILLEKLYTLETERDDLQEQVQELEWEIKNELGRT